MADGMDAGRAAGGAHPTILLVEDNPLTRGFLREVLLSGGYAVDEAPDGRTALEHAGRNRPRLVLQDMALPDMDGLELLRRLREALGPDVPIVALSGLPAELQRARGEKGVKPDLWFTDYIVKPVSPAALLLAVQAYATAGAPGAGKREEGRRRVVVVDAPGALEALGLRLGQEGFEATLAADGAGALAEARRHPPDAVVAGVLAPGLDGFRLCRALRTDPALARVPVLLVSGTFTTQEDRALARRMGASGLVDPGPGASAVPEALRAALAEPPPAVAPAGDGLDAAQADRVIEALRREAARRADLERRLAFQTAALSLIGVMAESLSRPGEAARSPGDLLARCLAAAGTSRGAAWLAGPDGRLDLAAQVGFGGEEAKGLADFFGRGDLLRRALEEKEPLVVPSDRVPAADAEALRERIRFRSVLLAPLRLGAEGLGVLAMVSGRFDLVDWVDLSRAVSLEVSQALTLGRAVARMADSEAHHRRVFEESPGALLRTDRAGIVAEANGALAALLGRPAASLAGTGASSLCVRPEEAAFLGERLRGTARFEGVELEWSRAGGAAVRVRLGGYPLRGDGGGVEGFHVVVEDVTTRREEEARRGGDRLAGVRLLAGGVGHDLNDLLTIVAGHAEMLAQSLAHEPDLHGHAREIQRCVERAGGLSRELLEFGGSGPGEPRALDVGPALEAALPLLRRVAGEAVEVKLRRGGGAGRIFADPAGLSQALAALAARARAGLPRGGVLEIEVANAVVDAGFAGRNPGMVPGAFVVVSARDGGAGEADEGLGAAEEFAERAGGRLLAKAESGRGRVVRLYLPRHEDASSRPTPAPALAGKAPRAPAPAPAPGLTVLLAEDEAAVRSLIAETLRLEGYTVLEASDGEAALRTAAESEFPPDLLVTDLMMPRLGGLALAERLRRKIPGIAVLYVTGYLDRTPENESATMVPGSALLNKPFVPADLVQRVREALAARGEAAR
jgi:PAS domain S-box-containing protein